MIRWERPCPVGTPNTRYYCVHLQQDLFGCWVLTRVWGRKGSRRGRIIHTLVDTQITGERSIARIARQRTRHEYRLVAGYPP